MRAMICAAVASTLLLLACGAGSGEDVGEAEGRMTDGSGDVAGSPSIGSYDLLPDGPISGRSASLAILDVHDGSLDFSLQIERLGSSSDHSGGIIKHSKASLDGDTFVYDASDCRIEVTPTDTETTANQRKRR